MKGKYYQDGVYQGGEGTINVLSQLLQVVPGPGIGMQLLWVKWGRKLERNKF